MNKIDLYNDVGFVSLVEVMGSDQAIEEAARLSYGKGTRSSNDRRNLIRYLIRHKHTSPIEQGVVRFHMKIPIFVMRQHVRHRTASLNEYSGRYSEMVDDFYIPEDKDIKAQSKSNKQGSEGELSSDTTLAANSLMSKISQEAYRAYRLLLNMGVSRELARIVLPVANFTECVWQINLHNFLHYSTLRTDSHAQKEIRVLADAMVELVRPHFPIVIEAWEDYQKGAKTLSRMEQLLLADVIREQSLPQELRKCSPRYGMSNREWQEFFDWYEKIMENVLEP